MSQSLPIGQPSGDLGQSWNIPASSISVSPTPSLQEPVLFGTTIMENIRFGKLDASDEEVYAAAREANAHEFICSFPEGYHTVVGECQGQNLLRSASPSGRRHGKRVSHTEGGALQG